MIEKRQQQWIAAKMVSAPNQVMMEKTVARKKAQQWIVAKMANALKKDIAVLIAARNPINNE
jgi:hypothetical protein